MGGRKNNIELAALLRLTESQLQEATKQIAILEQQIVFLEQLHQSSTTSRTPLPHNHSEISVRPTVERLPTAQGVAPSTQRLCPTCHQDIPVTNRSILAPISNATSRPSREQASKYAAKRRWEEDASSFVARIKKSRPEHPEHLDAASTQEPQHLEAVSSQEARRLEAPSSSQHLEAVSSQEARRLEALSSSQHLEATSTQEPQHLDAASSHEPQHLEAASTQEPQHLEATSTQEPQHLDAASSHEPRYLEAGSSPQHLEAESSWDLSHDEVVVGIILGTGSVRRLKATIKSVDAIACLNCYAAITRESSNLGFFQTLVFHSACAVLEFLDYPTMEIDATMRVTSSDSSALNLSRLRQGAVFANGVLSDISEGMWTDVSNRFAALFFRSCIPMSVYKSLAQSMAQARAYAVTQLKQLQLEETAHLFCIPAYVKHILHTPGITIKDICEALQYKATAAARVQEIYSKYDDCVGRMMQQWASGLSKDLSQTLSFPQLGIARTSDLGTTTAALAQINSPPDQHHGSTSNGSGVLIRDSPDHEQLTHEPNEDGVFMGGDGINKDQLIENNLRPIPPLINLNIDYYDDNNDDYVVNLNIDYYDVLHPWIDDNTIDTSNEL
ncbi:hypothetical protein L207DRAFT_510535 [Hyaloscypha variabilis F]|uniref:Uncharacterized protein n=1 Tax=Hyaloscypha variabilis (strain UAMH 11265 / GT02V1 / F) TaxID=1149755 RepID=A0A2J6RUW2_HYAVF|nr:hypothetical protein L207DRAFT_510535 [Hyaloscypha variabilis F]